MIRLIIHAPTAEALERAKRNLANLLASEPDAMVELVANGSAVAAVVADPAPELTPYVVLCENSLRAAQTDKPEGFRTTDAAVAHIARRAAEGWGYFRA